MGRGGPDTFLMNWQVFSNRELHTFIARENIYVSSEDDVCYECQEVADELDFEKTDFIGFMHTMYGMSICRLIGTKAPIPVAEMNFDIVPDNDEWPDCFENDCEFFCGEVLFATGESNTTLYIGDGGGSNLMFVLKSGLSSINKRTTFIKNRFDNVSFLSGFLKEIESFEASYRSGSDLILFERVLAC